MDSQISYTYDWTYNLIFRPSHLKQRQQQLGNKVIQEAIKHESVKLPNM